MKALFFLFNIEGYGEFFSGITPITIIGSNSDDWYNIKMSAYTTATTNAK
jgi:hypothetical protein